MTNDKPKVLKAMVQALGTTDGTHDTVAVIYGSNDATCAASAFIGDGDVLASALLCVLDHVGEGRATPAEMAITRAVLMAVAAADLRTNGQLEAAIQQHRDAIQSGTIELRNHKGEKH